MLEILFLILAASGIAAFARGRGGNPWVWGTIAVAGYVVFAYVVPPFLHPASDSAGRYVFLWGGAIAWVGAVAFCARFLLGSGRKKPSGMWVCPNCKYLNQQYAVQCEACAQPYSEAVLRR